MVDLDIPGAADLGTDPREQLLGDERLGDVVVGAGLEPGDDIMAVGLSGDDDDRHPAGRPDAANHVQAMDARQPEVDEQHIGILVLPDDQRLLPVRSLEDAVPVILEGIADHQTDLFVVLDDHHCLPHGPYSTPTWPC